jgi:hypothetical protein
MPKFEEHSRIAKLPHDKRGFPVPWFVAWDGDTPLFPVMDPAKFTQAIRQDKCWVCGEKLGKYKCFVIGPMCCINQITSEPPCHKDCAEFSAKYCPFLTQPKMRRVTTHDGYLDVPVAKPAGVMLAHNPGVTALWTATSYTVNRAPGGYLIGLGPFAQLEFWTRGRLATRQEVGDALEKGLPLLRNAAKLDGPKGQAECERAISGFLDMLHDLDWPDPPDRRRAGQEAAP